MEVILLYQLPLIEELDSLIEYRTLDGHNGSNRETQRVCQLDAQNDLQAIYCWLEEYRAVPTTFRNYRKEAERLLLWTVFQHKKPLSSLTRSDLEQYRKFTTQPQPMALWCGPKGPKRGTLGWKPFVKPLGVNAQTTAFSILTSLFSYLYEADYLAHNPLGLVRRKQSTTTRLAQPLKRLLEDDEWEATLDVLEQLPENDEYTVFYKARLKMAVYLLYFLGLRIQDLVGQNWNCFRKIGKCWWFFVVGKGGKEGKIPVNKELLLMIMKYRQFLGKPIEPSEDDDSPILTRYKKDERITDRRVNIMLKDISKQASKCFIDQPTKVKRLIAFSAHWLRHLSGTMQDRSGIKPLHIKENHRHAKFETTIQYIHAKDKARHEDMDKLKLRVNVNI